MLRHKLLLTLGSLLALLLVAALGAILILQNLLVDLDRINQEAIANDIATAQMASSLSLIDTEINLLMQNEPRAEPVNLEQAGHLLQEQAERLREPFHQFESSLEDRVGRILVEMPKLQHSLRAVSVASDEASGSIKLGTVLEQTSLMRTQMMEFEELARRHTVLDHERLVHKFRYIMLGLGLFFLVLINISIVVLLHAATMILKPVNALTDASRRLAREEFGHRVELERHDEFDELAASYNHLAEQLQLNEKRKMETLQQVARTINHELNNALSVIDLQLHQIEQSRPESQRLKKPLHQIHESLKRIGKTVDALKRVRRIVLTDYVSGVKMLDLERSIEEDPPALLIETRPVTEIKAK